MNCLTKVEKTFLFILILFFKATISKDPIKIILDGSIEDMMKISKPALINITKELNKFSLPQHTKQILFSIYKGKRRASAMSAKEFRELGNIAEGISDQDLDKIDYKDWKVINFLGTVQLSRRQNGIIAGGLERVYGRDQLKNSSYINHLLGILCGLNPSVLEQITAEEFLEIKEEVFENLHGCSDKQGKILLKIAIQAKCYGDTRIWTEHTVRHLGLLVTHLIKEAIECIQPEAARGLQPDTMRHFRNLNWLTNEQVKHLNASSLDVYREMVGIPSISSNHIQLTFVVICFSIVFKILMLINH